MNNAHTTKSLTNALNKLVNAGKPLMASEWKVAKGIREELEAQGFVKVYKEAPSGRGRAKVMSVPTGKAGKPQGSETRKEETRKEKARKEEPRKEETRKGETSGKTKAQEWAENAQKREDEMKTLREEYKKITCYWKTQSWEARDKRVFDRLTERMTLTDSSNEFHTCLTLVKGLLGKYGVTL